MNASFFGADCCSVTQSSNNNRQGSGFISHKTTMQNIPCLFVKHELSLDLADLKAVKVNICQKHDVYIAFVL